MKTTLLSLLTLICSMIVFSHASFAQNARPVVRIIYFLPKDRAPRPEIDTKMDVLIKSVQQFYANQMEAHGFPKKTFLFETDASRKAVVHHVNGKFNNAYYLQAPWERAWEEISQQFDTSKNIYFTAIDISSNSLGDTEAGYHTVGLGTRDGNGGRALIPVKEFIPEPGVKPIGLKSPLGAGLLAHELGHAFGLQHDFRESGKWISSPITLDRMVTSFCSAEALNVHRYFNAHRQNQNSLNNTAIQMLPPLASLPNAIRFRFKVTDPDGLHQANLEGPSGYYGGGSYGGWGVIGCKELDSTDNHVEFVIPISLLSVQAEYVTLQVIDIHGNLSRENFWIDLDPLLPPAKTVSIPDPHLAAVVRASLGVARGDAITTRTMLALKELPIVSDDPNGQIIDFTGLKHATNLKKLVLLGNAIPDLSTLAELTQITELWLMENSLSDISPLAGLTQLKVLMLSGNAISDISALAHLTQLTRLWLSINAISDVSALSQCTQLTELNLESNTLSDISPLTKLTQLTNLFLSSNAISDISPLAGLTQLIYLDLGDNVISDVSPLTKLTQLETLRLWNNPLSYASINKHIPSMEAKGVAVEINSRAHPALLKIGGDGQGDAAGARLKTPFVVEAQDKWGKPMKGVSVTFAVIAGGGRISTTTATTGVNGRAQTHLTLGRTLGINTIRATAKGIQSFVVFNAISEGIPIYWIESANGTLHRRTGTTVKNLVPRVRKATNVAVDTINSKLYWTEQTNNTTGKIRRANLDGSNPRLIKSLTSGLRSLAIDPVNGKLYLTSSSGRVRRLNVDGSNFEPNLITGLKSPKSLVLDIGGGKLYWLEQTSETTGKIQRANLDGSNVQLVRKLASVPHGLAIDPVNRKLYLTNSRGRIQRLNFNGSNFEGNLIKGLASPEGIAVDVAGDKLYWTEAGSISCANLRGKNIQDVITGLDTPTSIVLGITSPAPSTPAAPAMVKVSGSNAVLYPNYPNPFNPETWIPYQLAKPLEVTLHIYSVKGELVRTLALGHQIAGLYESRGRAAYWDGRNDQGEKVASGTYFYTLSTGDFSVTRKMLIRK